MTKNPVVNAVAAEAYIIGIVSLMSSFESILGKTEDTIFAPMVALSLFVLSAAVMGYIFVYQPLQLYLDGHKKEGTNLFLNTVGSFAVITAILIGILVTFSYF
jgi:hypothetical protein